MAEDAKIDAEDVRQSLAASLYRHRWPQMAGALVAITGFSVVYMRTHSPVFLGLMALGCVILLLRLILTLWIGRGGRAARTGLVETTHVIGVSLTAALLGGGTGYAILTRTEAFSTFILISIIMAMMVAVAGRGFGSQLGVRLQTGLMILPPVITGLFAGDISVAIMCLLLLPLGIETLIMAGDIRLMMSRKVMAMQRLAVIARRFNRALDTMPHGLAMLDAGRRVKLLNRQARNFFGVNERDSEGAAISSLVPAVLEGTDAKPRLASFREQLSRFLDSGLERMQVQLPGRVFMAFDGAVDADGSSVVTFEDVSARVHAEQKLLDMARLDSLTGLPNRHHFQELLHKVLERLPEGVTVGFLLIDVDDLKSINDNRGHAFGDRLLNEIGSRFGALMDAETLAARMISDQFGVFFFPRDCDEVTLKARIVGFHAGLQGNFTVGETVVSLSFSGGYVLLANSETLGEAWQVKADLALSEAKGRSRGLCVCYAPEMDERYAAQSRLKADFRQALLNAGLTAVFQPMYNIDGTKVECCEALARWTHPDRGPVSPDIFIRMAEDMRIVSMITRLMLESACQECLRWPEHVAVSVNLSAHDLRSHEVVEIVAGILAQTGLAPHRLHLEVTESCLMDEPVSAGALLAELRAMGITIAVDDFGTGFSSLAYLDTLPLDVVKIDRSFVRNVTRDSRRLKLLKGTVDLVRTLGLKVVVEGVETPEQLAVIAENGAADRIQGYVFSRPLSAEKVYNLLSA